MCSSAKFFGRLYKIKESLEKEGHEVLLPSMRDFHHLEETALAEIHHDLIREHFRKIDKSDAIYVANYDKDGMGGYIGGSVFLEIGKAFDRGIPIFLMNAVPQQAVYREELLAMRPIVIGENWERLEQHSHSKSK